MKKVTGVYKAGSTHMVGDGFPVRNLFPSNGLSDGINPFLMLDFAGPVAVEPSDAPRGVEGHPHRGFETITVVYQGAVEHRDSGGNSGTIGPGEVQWMTAASGVVHEEKYEREFARTGGTLEMVQLWLNLPRAHKMSSPRYQTLTAADIPDVSLAGLGRLRVIAGEYEGTTGAAKTFTPVNLWDVRLSAGQQISLTLPEGHNSGVVLLKGSISVNSDALPEGGPSIAVLSPEGNDFAIHASKDSVLLVLSGQPIDEPVESYGPFVMNTREELVQAFQDYKAGRMGQLS